MKRGTLSKAVAATLLAIPMMASAALRDVGPVNPATAFPEWYRDTNMTPVALCTDQRPSPNASAGGAPMCFPIVPDPAGFPGNIGGEIFYFDATANIAGAGGFSALYQSAIEATYGTGIPVKGDEITFARIRIVLNTSKGGNYTVTHPYGKETFTNVPGNAKRGVTFTIDVGVSTGIFTGALGGAVGPFLQWDANPLQPAAPYGFDPVSGLPYSLRLANPDGTFNDFIGDPNFAHTVTGSPFGTNYVRIDGPPGSNLDGLGNDFIVSNLFNVLGQVYMNPIPTPMEVCRANYGVTVNPDSTQTTQVDIFAEAGLGSSLLATGTNIPTLPLFQDGTGYAVAHAEFVAPGALPPTITVTNLTDNPHSKIVAPLTDAIQSGPAVFFPDLSGATAGSVSIVAETSIHTTTPPVLSVVELPGIVGVPDAAKPWVQTFTATIPTGTVPPWDLTIVSQAGGQRVEKVIFNPTGALVPVGPPALPFAAPQSLTTGTGTAVSFSAVDPAFPAATVTVLNPPAAGTAVVSANGTITYTPKPLFSGQDTFTYILSFVDTAGKTVYSNAADVTVSVAFVNAAPTATNDVATTAAATPVVINVAQNDVDLDGTVVPTSVTIVTPPIAVAGSVVNNANGTITFTPAAGFVGTVTFTYTIADNLGAVSAPGTVTVTVFSANEVLTITAAQWIQNKARWKVNGTSSIFGPGLANVVTVYIGRPPALGKKVGTATISPTGGWAIDVIDSTLALDATGAVTAISTGGGTASLLVQRK